MPAFLEHPNQTWPVSLPDDSLSHASNPEITCEDACCRAARDWGTIRILFEAWASDTAAAGRPISENAYVVPYDAAPKAPEMSGPPQPERAVCGPPQDAPVQQSDTHEGPPQTRRYTSMQPPPLEQQRTGPPRPGSAAHMAHSQPGPSNAFGHAPQGQHSAEAGNTNRHDSKSRDLERSVSVSRSMWDSCDFYCCISADNTKSSDAEV